MKTLRYEWQCDPPCCLRCELEGRPDKLLWLVTPLGASCLESSNETHTLTQGAFKGAEYFWLINHAVFDCVILSDNVFPYAPVSSMMMKNQWSWLMVLLGVRVDWNAHKWRWWLSLSLFRVGSLYTSTHWWVSHSPIMIKKWQWQWIYYTRRTLGWGNTYCLFKFERWAGLLTMKYWFVVLFIDQVHRILLTAATVASGVGWYAWYWRRGEEQKRFIFLHSHLTV